MDKIKEFTSNTVLLAVGKFFTQSLSLILLPMYTRYLLVEDFGFVELINSYVALLLPLITLRIESAVFRFIIDLKEDSQQTRELLSTTIAMMCVGVTIASVLICIIKIVFPFKYMYLTGVYFVTMVIRVIFLQILRGYGMNKQYSLISVLMGVTTLLINIVLIYLLKGDAGSILISGSISNVICIIYYKCDEINTIY